MHRDRTDRPVGHAAFLRAIVDQFVERRMHPISDVKQFEQLALGLIDIVEAEEAARLTRPLCLHPETPPSVFARLLAKGGPCAELALQYAPKLPRGALMVAAQGDAPALACAVARRGELDRDIVEALLRHGAPGTLRALAANWALRLDVGARRILAQAARDDRALARILLDRDDCGAEAEGLFLAATRHERTEILLEACRRALSAGQGESRAADPALVVRLEAAASQNDRTAMAAILAEALDCPTARALAILDDPQGEPLALALAALGVDPDAAARIFLCADFALAHETGRVRTLSALMRAVPQSAAMQIVAAIAGGAKSEAARRPKGRDDPPAAPGWRRGAHSGSSAPARKFDRLA